MGNCSICGEPAGFLRSIHQECQTRRDRALQDMDLAFSNMMLVDRPPTPAIFRTIIEKLAADAKLGPRALRSRILIGLSKSLDTALSDFDLSDIEIKRFEAILSAFDLDAQALNEAGIRDRIVKALVLKDLSEGHPSTRLRISEPLPLAMKKNEVIQWLFNNVVLKAPRTKVSYVGGSAGFSFRVMKGVSYRIGSHRGERVETTEVVTIGNGALVATTSALYFSSPPNTKKTQLSSIVSVDTYDDGILISTSRGKPQIYLMDDPLFASNLILRLGALN